MWLFQFETQSGELLPAEMRQGQLLAAFEPYANSLFLVHGILFVLMVAATFIDFDERIIPDMITILLHLGLTARMKQSDQIMAVARALLLLPSGHHFATF